VTFAGQVSEERKWQLLQVADVYLSATMHEGFGLVYLEAMAAGLPVITYDEGGQVDFLSDGETGYLIPAGNEAALAAALTRALRCREKLREMGAANRRRAPAHRIEHCAAAYESLFQRVIARAPADRRRPATVPGP
jgi:glycosyltransferase involved in cell wall biosynthesis